MSLDNSLTPEEVAEILRIKKSTVYELIKRGELTAYQIGRKYRIEQKDVENYKTRSKNRASRSGERSPGAIAAAAVTGPGSGEDRSAWAPVAQSPAWLAPGLSEKEEASTQGGESRPLITGVINDTLDAIASPRPASSLVICGLDMVLDILARHLETGAGMNGIYRKHVGSFQGLQAMYRAEADMAGIHLWDGDSGTYNIPYVRRLLPGIPCVILHIVQRWQGFYVPSGNPRGIQDWPDLARGDLRFLNREPGCGVRVLIDEKIRALSMDRSQINGYEHCEHSHAAIASAVARGAADFGIGIEKAALQVRGIEFIPLQKERYELAVLNDARHQDLVRQVTDTLRSQQFRDQVNGLGDYDLSDTGQLVATL